MNLDVKIRKRGVSKRQMTIRVCVKSVGAIQIATGARMVRSISQTRSNTRQTKA